MISFKVEKSCKISSYLLNYVRFYYSFSFNPFAIINKSKVCREESCKSLKKYHFFSPNDWLLDWLTEWQFDKAMNRWKRCIDWLFQVILASWREPGVGKVCRMFLGLCSEIAADTTLNMMDDRGLPRHYSIRHPSLLLLSNLNDAAQMPNPRWWRPGHQGFHFNTWSGLATFSILFPTHFFSHNFLIKPTCFFNFRVIKPI